MRVLVIGLDGATFDLIKPWVARGKLPTIERLMKNGVYGDLISTIPPVTSPAWPSFMTGKNPGKHGVFDFVGRDKEYNKRIKTARDIRAKTLWRLLSDARKTCIVVNVPVTYPPEKIRGCIVTGMLTPPDACYAYPYEIYEELREMGYKPQIEAEKYSSPKALLECLIEKASIRTEVTLHLMNKFSNWDFCMLVFRGTDIIQHHFWEYKDVILQFYQKIDTLIGDIINHVGSETNIILMSDHGFGPSRKFFHVNYFLHKLGLLEFTSGNLSGDYLHIRDYRISQRSRFWKTLLKIGLTKETIYSLAKKTNTLFILQKISRKISVQIPKTRKAIDWKRTKAFFSSSIGPSAAIEINVKGREPEGIVEEDEYRKIKELIIKELLKVKDPENGQNIIQDAFRREDIYYGPYVSEAPDIIFLTSNLEYIATDRIYGDNLVSEPVRKGRGTHRMNGIFIAYGPEIKAVGEVKRARIIDLTPTILHMFGSEIPEDMDGKVLTYIFNPDSSIAKRTVKYRKVTEEEKIKEKIRRVNV